MTWNPVTGCKHGCPYCYARKIAERFRGSKAWPQGFKPMMHENRMGDPQKVGTQYCCPRGMERGKTIFVCSMADLFGEWVPREWIQSVFLACEKAPWHTYIFLTKNPDRYQPLSVHSCFEEFMNQKNVWFGTTITGKTDIRRLGSLQASDLPNLFVSFEPLLEDPGYLEIDNRLDLTGIKQVIIGAQTNPDHYVGLEWVMKICEAADRAGAKVFMKDSLAGRWPDRELRRELAWGIHK
jgi:protein gp37